MPSQYSHVVAILGTRQAASPVIIPTGLNEPIMKGLGWDGPMIVVWMGQWSGELQGDKMGQGSASFYCCITWQVGIQNTQLYWQPHTDHFQWTLNWSSCSHCSRCYFYYE